MVPTIVGLTFVVIGLLGWVTFLTIKLYESRGLVADTLDAHTTLYIKLNGRVKVVEARQYPKYLDAVVPVENAPECATPDPVWGEHDARVKEALTHGTIKVTPEMHPFFSVSDEDSTEFDVDTSDRLAELRRTVTAETKKEWNE